MEARDRREMTHEEYVALERTAFEKHEYVNGRVYAMAGGSPEHARLAAAISAELRAALRGRPCAAFTSDLRVRILATGRSTYPDVSVVCGQFERAPGDEDAVTNPTLLVEVLSDSTEHDDRGEEWAHYQRVPTLREYVLVSQHARRVEVFSRDEADPRLWHYREYRDGARAALPGLGVELDVDEVYSDPLSAR